MEEYRESEPMISKFALEMIDATHQQTVSEMTKNHKHAMNIMWRVILVMGILLLLALILIGIGVYEWSQYDTISYDQDGRGINIIGDDNRGYYNEPEIAGTPETEP